MERTATEQVEAVGSGSSAACQCTLDPEHILARVGEWVALARDHLHSRAVGDGEVTGVYERREDVRARLEALIQAEQECCSFLEFALDEQGDHIRVTVAYPPGAESILALVVPELGE